MAGGDVVLQGECLSAVIKAFDCEAKADVTVAGPGLTTAPAPAAEPSAATPVSAVPADFDVTPAIVALTRYLPQGHSLQLRAFYTPNINIDKSNRTRQLVDGQYRVSSNTLQYALLLEYANTRLGPVADALNLYYMFYQYRDFYNDGTNADDPPNNPLDSATAHRV